MEPEPKFWSSTHPAGGWGSVQSVGRSLTREHVPLSGSRILAHQNKLDESWTDHQLEEKGRLTQPLRWDARTDKYLPVDWTEAAAEIGRELKALDPKSVVFYSSGRGSLETSYMYALFARMYGTRASRRGASGPTYDGSSHAVMMATPADLEDFGVGFSLCEGLVQTVDQIETLRIIPGELGIEVRMFLTSSQPETLRRRRRYRAGPTGSGLCGVESLTEALPPLPPITSRLRVTADSVRLVLNNLALHQHLNRQAHALHAAAFCREGHALIVREDVGRHNALDKLAGALAREGIAAARDFVVLSGRVSIDMAQKAALMGTSIIIAVSAPTALAVRACEAAGLTLVAIARDDSFEVFTHPERIGGTSWRSVQKARGTAA